MTEIIDDEYTCAGCGATFKTTWTDQEAMAQAAENGFTEADDLAIVCEDCYQQIMGGAVFS